MSIRNKIEDISYHIAAHNFSPKYLHLRVEDLKQLEEELFLRGNIQPFDVSRGGMHTSSGYKLEIKLISYTVPLDSKNPLSMSRFEVGPEWTKDRDGGYTYIGKVFFLHDE